MKEIKLKGVDTVTIVDEEDYYRFAGLSWYLSSNGYVGMCVAQFKQRDDGFPQNLYLHRLVMACSDEKFVDHINGNPLDNRKSNLRFCTHQQNMQNANKQDGNRRAKYKGVFYKGGKTPKAKHWFSLIQHNGKSKYLGTFHTEEEAHEAYKKACIELHGEYSFYKRGTFENK